METFVRRYTAFSKTDIRIEKNSFFSLFKCVTDLLSPSFFIFPSPRPFVTQRAHTHSLEKEEKSWKGSVATLGKKTYPLPLCTPWILNPCQKLRSPSDRGIFFFFFFFTPSAFPHKINRRWREKDAGRALLGRNCYTAYHVLLLPRVFFKKKKKRKKGGKRQVVDFKSGGKESDFGICWMPGVTFMPGRKIRESATGKGKEKWKKKILRNSDALKEKEHFRRPQPKSKKNK